MAERILIVEDEPGLSLTLTDRLEREGYEVSAARDGLSGLDRAMRNRFDLIILDLMLPGKSGLDVCRELRQHGYATPILMLTARSQTVDKVLGLKIGGDDYLTKPFAMAELLARVEALLRRSAQKPGGASLIYQHDFLTIDFRRSEVLRDGKPVTLSAKEFQLLHYFVEHPQETISREELLREVWGYDSLPTTRTVDVHVAWLRQKLEEDPKHPQLILTAIGRGYKFNG